ncbi:MAG TPA: DUF2007 domain-containing protein [Pseudomonadales bacterium]|nr:DUF2007 domain-containing protein [Pseudomonadales bacterium]
MELAYAHANPMMVQYAAQLLAQNGIVSELRNQFVTSVMGSGAPCDAWPEVWVANERLATALAILRTMTDGKEGVAWQCPACGETNDASFDVCWYCQSEGCDDLP